MPKRNKLSKRKKFAAGNTSSKKLLRYFLQVVFVSLLVGGAFKLISAWNARQWSGDARFTVVLTGDAPVVFSYQEGAGLAIIPLPEKLELQGAYNVGRWKVGSLSGVGKIQGIGDKLVATTLQNTFGFPIDGWVRGDINTPYSVVFTTDSNLAFFDKIRVAMVILATSPELRREISLERVGMVRKSGETLISSDKDLPRELVDTKVASEGIGVGVVNKTKKGGLGRRTASVVEGMGAPVLWIRTEVEVDGNCTVRGSKKTLDSLTARKIIHLFSCKIQKEESLASSIELILETEIAQQFP